MAQWGHHSLDTTNTKQLLLAYSKRNTCHARLTCTRIYDAHAYSAHWREAKMRMRIPS